jgi:hypothetical protein
MYGWIGLWGGVFGIISEFGWVNHCTCVHAAFRDIKFSFDYVRVPSGIRDSVK